jgi:hypothetical protein
LFGPVIECGKVDSAQQGTAKGRLFNYVLFTEYTVSQACSYNVAKYFPFLHVSLHPSILASLLLAQRHAVTIAES